MDISSGLSNSFKQQAMKHSKGKVFWDTFSDENARTPPPPSMLPRHSSSGISDDLALDSSALSTPSSGATQTNIFSINDSQASSNSTHTGPTQAEIRTKVNNKRRRDDDFDVASFKRRAVSPGMSVHNSPNVPSSMGRDNAPWGSRPSSGGDGAKAATGSLKRIGLQGMTDTSENLMKMSIE